jgi:hypothetical protein
MMRRLSSSTVPFFLCANLLTCPPPLRPPHTPVADPIDTIHFRFRVALVLRNHVPVINCVIVFVASFVIWVPNTYSIPLAVGHADANKDAHTYTNAHEDEDIVVYAFTLTNSFANSHTKVCISAFFARSECTALSALYISVNGHRPDGICLGWLPALASDWHFLIFTPMYRGWWCVPRKLRWAQDTVPPHTDCPMDSQGLSPPG